MSYKINKKDYDNFVETVEKLEDLLTERISELHKVKGMMQCRHAYIYYRSLLLKARNFITNCKV